MRTKLVYSGLLLFLLIMGVIFQLNMFISWDVSWYITAVQRFLAGGTYHNDFFETNPPMILYLYSLPVYLAHWFHFNVYTFLRLFYFVVSVGSLGLCYVFLKKIYHDDRHSLGLMLVGLGFCYWILPVYEFMQRDYLMFLFVLPYVFSVVLRANSVALNKWLMLFIGVLAGLGVGLKPYFLCVPVLLELFLMIYSRRWLSGFRVETLTIIATLFVYLAVIAWLNPDYYTQVLPWVLFIYPYSMSYPQSSLLLAALLPVFYLSVILGLASLPWSRKRCFLWVLLIANISFLFSYLLQAKPWYYHLFPAIGASTLLLLFLIRESVKRTTVATLIVLTVSVLTLAAFPFAQTCRLLGLYLQHNNVLDTDFVKLLHLIRHYRHKGKLYMLSGGVAPFYWFVPYVPIESASRFPMLWPVSGMVHLAEQETSVVKLNRMLGMRQKLFDMVVEDFSENQPGVVVVDAGLNKRYLQDSEFDYIKFFSQDARFRTLWRAYHYVAFVDGYAVYVR